MRSIKNKYISESYLNLDRSFKFDGQSTRVKVPDWNFEFLGPNHSWSVSFFIKDSGNSGDVRIINHKNPLAASGLDFVLTAAKTIQLRIYDLGPSQNFDSTYILKENIWYLITCVYTPTTIKFYKNSKLLVEYNHTLSNFSNLNKNLSFGGLESSNGSFSQFFNGHLSYVRIFSKELLEYEILNIVNEPAYIHPDSRKNIIGEWTFQNKISY